jgi:O-antigen biosynthesis protein WbqP
MTGKSIPDKDRTEGECGGLTLVQNPAFSSPQERLNHISKLKRLTDLFLSTILLFLLAPICFLVAILIRLDSPGPAIFQQKRIGLDGELFEIYKFRTMYVGTPDLATDKMKDLPSPITRVGNILRKTSLDELPQLINVALGNMSLVGPRPALYNQLELTAKRKSNGVLRFPPGITGWAQINGRDDLSDDLKVEADTWYCQNWNYWLDWQIMFATFKAVLTKRGAI